MTKQIYHQDSELLQLGRILDIDFTPLIKMTNYPTEYFIEDKIRRKPKNEEEQLRRQFEEEQFNTRQNIPVLRLWLKELYQAAQKRDDLPDLIEYNRSNSNRFYGYLSDFEKDTGHGYRGNNLGQDLRNFFRYLDYAESKGAKYVYFRFG